MKTDSTIYHFALCEDWESQLKNENYFPSAFLKEGFIHCSKENQLDGVLKRFFKDEDKVVLLTIDSNKIIAELKLEQASNGDFFPHIYGEINKTAIYDVEIISVNNFQKRI